ncbi:MAG: HAD family phosphatase [Ruminococcus sp.]|nr:HAD family phosphatase [Ruminococcus sp.]
MQKIKMIGLDLDGTLLTSEKKLTAYTKSIIKRALDEGIVVLVATGRPYTGIPQELRDISKMRYALTSNGARILDTWTGEVLIEQLFPLESAKKALAIFYKYDTLQEVYFDGQGYVDKDLYDQVERFHHNPFMWEYFRESRKPVPSMEELIAEKDCDMDKVQALFADVSQKQAAWDELAQHKEFELVNSLGYNIEINAAGVNKGTGLVRLGEMLGIRREEIMACGDSDNDITMLSEVGFGVAMANAHDEVKAAADYITESNDNDGVAKAIERFALKGESIC